MTQRLMCACVLGVWVAAVTIGCNGASPAPAPAPVSPGEYEKRMQGMEQKQGEYKEKMTEQQKDAGKDDTGTDK